MPQIGAVHFDETIFPEPDQFKPERFFDPVSLELKRIDEFNPFGLGKRACLGESLARQELFLILTALLQHFTFSPIPGLLDDIDSS